MRRTASSGVRCCSSTTKSCAARIGPTELEGPTPILKWSRTLMIWWDSGSKKWFALIQLSMKNTYRCMNSIFTG